MRLRTTLLLPALLPGCLWLWSGCAVLENSAKKKLCSTTVEEQDDSFEPYSKTRVEGRKIWFHINDRIAVVLSAEELEIDQEDGARNFTVNSTSTDTGSAVAIDPRGYFLTAAHCVDRAENYVVFLESRKEKKVAVKQARVIFNGEKWTKDYYETLSAEEKKGISEWHLCFDFAILHVDSPLKHVFHWSETAAKEELVIGAGTTSKEDEWHLGMNCFAGKIFEDSSYELNGVSWQFIEHDSPVRRGNSGGPLVNLQGELVGINFLCWIPRFKPNQKYTSAIRPDIEFVKELIEKDYEENVAKE